MRRRRYPISRRTFLRGAGAAIALPFLNAMKPLRAATSAKPPVRFAVLFFPNGVWKPGWIPKEIGADYELPFALTPIAKLKPEILVLSGLDKAQSRDGDGHYAKTANFLTGLKVIRTTGKELSVGSISVDQLMASKIGTQTPLPSLELGIDPVVSGIDTFVGYTRLYGSHISWRAANVPVAKEINPRLVYERLFGGKTDSAARRADDQSLLDLALEDARSLRKNLGRDDQFKLDEYLDSVRAVEKRIEFFAKPDGRPWKPAGPPDKPQPPRETPPQDYAEHCRLMLDLMALAFWTDQTRVTSLMFANDVSPRNFSFVDGVRGGHHDISHHSKQESKIEQYQRINRWHVGQFAYLCEKLRAIKEGEGTLLDNSLVLLGSSLADGNGHEPNNLPILLGGRGGGSVQSGRHIASAKNTPLCNLYVSLLDGMGTPVKSFGDSTGPLAIS
jgi:Protein of unknown function (DUF1552)